MVGCIIPFRENTGYCVNPKKSQNLGIKGCAAIAELTVPHGNHFVFLEILVKQKTKKKSHNINKRN